MNDILDVGLANNVGVEECKVAINGKLTVAVNISNYIVLISYDEVVELECVEHCGSIVLVKVCKGGNSYFTVSEIVVHRSDLSTVGTDNKLFNLAIVNFTDSELSCLNHVVSRSNLELENYELGSALDSLASNAAESYVNKTGRNILGETVAHVNLFGRSISGAGECSVNDLGAYELNCVVVILNSEVCAPNINTLEGVDGNGYEDGSAGAVNSVISIESELNTGAGACLFNEIGKSFATCCASPVVCTCVCIVFLSTNELNIVDPGEEALLSKEIIVILVSINGYEGISVDLVLAALVAVLSKVTCAYTGSGALCGLLPVVCTEGVLASVRRIVVVVISTDYTDRIVVTAVNVDELTLSVYVTALCRNVVLNELVNTCFTLYEVEVRLGVIKNSVGVFLLSLRLLEFNGACTNNAGSKFAGSLEVKTAVVAGCFHLLNVYVRRPLNPVIVGINEGNITLSIYINCYLCGEICSGKVNRNGTLLVANASLIEVNSNFLAAIGIDEVDLESCTVLAVSDLGETSGVAGCSNAFEKSYVVVESRNILFLASSVGVTGVTLCTLPVAILVAACAGNINYSVRTRKLGGSLGVSLACCIKPVCYITYVTGVSIVRTGSCTSCRLACLLVGEGVRIGLTLDPNVGVAVIANIYAGSGGLASCRSGKAGNGSAKHKCLDLSYGLACICAKTFITLDALAGINNELALGIELPIGHYETVILKSLGYAVKGGLDGGIGNIGVSNCGSIVTLCTLNPLSGGPLRKNNAVNGETNSHIVVSSLVRLKIVHYGLNDLGIASAILCTAVCTHLVNIRHTGAVDVRVYIADVSGLIVDDPIVIININVALLCRSIKERVVLTVDQSLLNRAVLLATVLELESRRSTGCRKCYSNLSVTCCARIGTVNVLTAVYTLSYILTLGGAVGEYVVSPFARCRLNVTLSLVSSATCAVVGLAAIEFAILVSVNDSGLNMTPLGDRSMLLEVSVVIGVIKNSPNVVIHILVVLNARKRSSLICIGLLTSSLAYPVSVTVRALNNKISTSSIAGRNLCSLNYCSLGLISMRSMVTCRGVNSYLLGSAALAGEDSHTAILLATLPVGLGLHFGEFPSVSNILGENASLFINVALCATESTSVELLAANTGGVNEIMNRGGVVVNGLVTIFAILLTTNSTNEVLNAVGLVYTACSDIACCVLRIRLPSMFCLGSQIVHKRIAAGLTNIFRVTNSFAGGGNSLNLVEFAVCGCVYGRALGDSRERRRRYERQNHDCCQHKRKNLFHVFFPFEKMFFGVRHAMLSTRYCVLFYDSTQCSPPPYTKRQLIHFGIA